MQQVEGAHHHSPPECLLAYGLPTKIRREKNNFTIMSNTTWHLLQNILEPAQTNWQWLLSQTASNLKP